MDVGHYQGQCERLELVLDALCGEKDGEMRGGGRGQADELLTKKQSQLAMEIGWILLHV